MNKQAWQLEREFRDAAVPVDRRGDIFQLGAGE